MAILPRQDKCQQVHVVIFCSPIDFRLYYTYLCVGLFSTDKNIDIEKGEANTANLVEIVSLWENRMFLVKQMILWCELARSLDVLVIIFSA